QGRKLLQRPLAVETSYTGCLFPAKGNQGIVVDSSVINVNCSRIDLLGKFGAAFHIARVNGPTQSKGAPVRDLNRFFGTVERHDANRGTEHFVLSNGHVRANIGKDCGGDEIAVCLALQDYARAFILSTLNLFRQSLSLGFIHNWAEIRI